MVILRYAWSCYEKNQHKNEEFIPHIDLETKIYYHIF